MAAGTRDIDILKGDDYSHEIKIGVRSAAGVITYTNITGRVFTSQLRKVKTQVLPDVSFTVTMSDPANGTFVISLTHTQTAALDVGCYFWDVQQSVGGIISTVLKGKANVSADVTR